MELINTQLSLWVSIFSFFCCTRHNRDVLELLELLKLYLKVRKQYKNGLGEKEFGKNTESQDDRGGKEPLVLPPFNPSAKAHCLEQVAQESIQAGFSPALWEDSPTSLGRLSQWSVPLKVKKIFLMFKWNFRCSTLCPLSCHWSWPKRAWPHALNTHPLGIHKHW